MAVKKHKLVHDNKNQADLEALVKCIQLLNDQSGYIPSPRELAKNCQEIVKSLARLTVNDEQVWETLQNVEDYLVRVVNDVHRTFRREIVTAILDKFNSLISDPQSDASPATSVVLIVLNGADARLSAARWLVQQAENGPAGAGLRASLSCLYRWLYEWQGTPALGDWVMAYLKALEETERYDILIEVSVDNLGNLFQIIADPAPLRQSVADVIFHVLSSLRESTEALDRISPHVGRILENLAADSNHCSRHLLQNIVDILSAMFDHLIDSFKGDAQDMFRDKYADVILCLEPHMVSPERRLSPPWRARSLRLRNVAPHLPTRKVGLLNLGNTCYMNSVMQALLVTRQFSTHVMLKMNKIAYWSRMGMLFGKMMYSVTTKLNPDEFFTVFKPPFFTLDNQHDSSEFLGYLFELLQSYEHISDFNFDYTRPAVLNGVSRTRALPSIAQGSPTHQGSSENENASGSQRRSISPRPGSSAAGTSSSPGCKRASGTDDGEVIQKKRMRVCDYAFSRRDSYVDSMFGGVLLTRVECTVCHSSSLSRDVFRDLQLAFPEKPEGWPHSVQSLLEYYCSKESLSGDNKYECRDCGGLRDAERSVLIETTPKYLILVLKHFKFDPKLQVQTKLMHSIRHDHSVTIPTVRSQAIHSSYVLYAAVIHTGTTLDSGHYYTLAKDGDQWHTYNDDIVSGADERQLHGLDRSSTPYILFYRRQDVEEGAAPALEDLPPNLQESVIAHNKHYVETVRNARVTRP